MWGDICSLYERYPKALAYLKDGWWKDSSHVEMLCAFVIWRATIDVYGANPREELDFQAELLSYGHVLRQEGGGVSTAWKPGPQPPEWASGKRLTS